MLNLADGIQQGSQQTNVSQNQQSQDDRLHGNLKQKVDSR